MTRDTTTRDTTIRDTATRNGAAPSGSGASVIYLPAPRTPGPSARAARTDPVPVGPGPHPLHLAGWLPVEVEFADPMRAAATGAHLVAPVLDALCRLQGPGARWWFVNDAGGWRVYLQGVPTAAAVATLTRTSRARSARTANMSGGGRREFWTARVTTPRRPVAEDRPVLGGQTGTKTSPARGRRRAEALAALHVADTRGVMAHLRQPPGFAPRYLAGILTAAMCRAAGLDDADAADFLERYWPLPGRLDAAELDQARGLAGMLTLYLRTPIGDLLESEPAVAWAADLTGAAGRLRAAAYEGFVTSRHRPVPEFLRYDLAHAIGAHWNRLGLSGREQTVLSVALRTTLWRTRRTR